MEPGEDQRYANIPQQLADTLTQLTDLLLGEVPGSLERVPPSGCALRAFRQRQQPRQVLPSLRVMPAHPP